MLGNLINLIYRGLSIKRWNNYPRIEEFVETEHLSLILHTSYIISKILQENGEKVNISYIYTNIFWSSFFTFIYSDINFDVKQYLKNKYTATYKKLRENLLNFFQHINLPEELKNYYLIFSSKIDYSLFENDFKIENQIISLSKELVAYFEIKNNAKFYPVYNKITKSKLENINRLSNELSLNNIELIEQYLEFLLRLKFNYRWNRLNRKYPVSVLSHLFLVFTFSYFLGKLKKYDDIQMEEILTISLMHDLPEALTGDVITPTKKSVSNLPNILEELETILVNQHILSLFKKYNFASKLSQYILTPFSSNIGKIAKMSDNLSAMFEAKIEKNNDFNKVYYDIKRYLWKLGDTELDYILNFGVDYFDDDIETKWKKFIGLIK